MKVLKEPRCCHAITEIVEGWVVRRRQRKRFNAVAAGPDRVPDRAAGCAPDFLAVFGENAEAARMEDAAAAHGVRCILSETVAEALANPDRIHEIGEEAVRGISATVRVCEYRPRLDRIPIEHRTALTACTRRAGGSRYVQP